MKPPPSTVAEILALGYDFGRIIVGPPPDQHRLSLAVRKLLFWRAQLSVDLDDFGAKTTYTYLSLGDACRAMWAFDPKTMREPEGWYRCDTDGRRRSDLTAATEVVRL